MRVIRSRDRMRTKFSENLDVDILTRYTHQYFDKHRIMFESNGSATIGDSKLIISPLFDIYFDKTYEDFDRAYIKELEIDESRESKINIDIYLLDGDIKELNDFRIHVAYVVFVKDVIILELIPAV